jgi:Xaa-Pro dipeptidase
MIKRRDLLKGLAAGTAAAAASTTTFAKSTTAGATPIEIVKAESFPHVDGKALINYERAYDVLEEDGIDGLIALNWLNVYYLTNTVSIGTKFRSDFASFATFPRAREQPRFFVGMVPEGWDLANRVGDELPELMPFSGAMNWQDYINADAAQTAIKPEAFRGGFNMNEDLIDTPREKGWQDAQNKYSAIAEPSRAWALAKALKESGLDRGVIAVDDMRIRTMLESIGAADNIKFVDGRNTFRKIRHVKSAVEIELMRIGGQKNAAAALATARSLEVGMRFEDIERRFTTECAARGNEKQFIIAGVSIGLLPHGEIVPGEAILIDAVSHFRQYHGDFARTIVAGDPPKEVLRRAKANEVGRAAILEKLKPGVKYSEIRKFGFEAMVKAGMPAEAIIVGPHSVGLEHGDDPIRDDTPFPVPSDVVLKAGMTITVDLPYIEVGWGAGHNEDLILITDTGYELLNTDEEPLVIV